jgi:hypothetical protein
MIQDVSSSNGIGLLDQSRGRDARRRGGASRLKSWSRGWVAMLAIATTLRAEEVWRVDNLAKIGGHAVEVIGAPKVTEEGGVKAVVFDGAKDGLFVPAIPFAGAKAFTVEILFYPAEGGLPEQRFFHAQDSNPWRALIETRLDGKGGWWLDTFIITGTPPDSGLALIDPKLVHATNKWYWAALRYDGKTMIQGRDSRSAVSHRGAGTGEVAAGKVMQAVLCCYSSGRE